MKFSFFAIACGLLLSQPVVEAFLSQWEGTPSAFLYTGQKRAAEPTESSAESKSSRDDDKDGGGSGDFWEGWTSSAPDSEQYNEETHVSWLPCSVEGFFARLYCLILASSPLVLAALTKDRLTKAHLLESCALLIWLGGTMYLFCNVLKFQSAHFVGTRPLTLVEAVYLMSQILTTVGYGDITPAFPRGQVWVGINVIVALCLYGSMVMEVVGMVQDRIREATKKTNEASEHRVKNWVPKVDNTGFVQTVVFFSSMVTIGVLFWRLYPGEGKTWFQAVYMSIITLSTVGFGAFTATTEGGKIFAAYWMLFGVASLASLIGGFVDWMSAQKQLQSFYLCDHREEFTQVLNSCSSDQKKLTKMEFLEFAVKLNKPEAQSDIDEIKQRFESLKKKEISPEKILRTAVIIAEEGPTF
mmetsp:Transcript_14930/g.32236  ORF Transcript_14930/g.32236 Transcript_14930/m.32236 type:complete len:413 (-) Transcript_14930:61-1299(-)